MYRHLLRHRFVWAIAFALVSLSLVGCSFWFHFNAVRFEPLSPSIEGKETELKRGWQGWMDGSPRRELKVIHDGIEVRVSGSAGGSPGSCRTANVIVHVLNSSDEPIRIRYDTAELRPQYNGDYPGAPAALHPLEPREGWPDNPEFIKTEGRFVLPFLRWGWGPGVPVFKRAEVDFTLVLGDNGQEYRYRFHLKKD